MKTPYVYKLYTGKVKRLGKPGAKDPLDREWETGMFKRETNQEVFLTKTNLKGDEVADKKVHGGPEKALFAYPVDHYEYWRQNLQMDTIGPGAFGENLAVKSMTEETVCIGDIYKLGEAIIQVSQPRRPCWKPARRFKVLDFALRIQKSGLTGWYFRVLKEGLIKNGQKLILKERTYPEWTIKRANEVMYTYKKDQNLTKALAMCEPLAENWKETLNRRLRGIESKEEKRVFGPNKS